VTGKSRRSSLGDVLTEAREAHEMLGKGGVTGKIVLVPARAS
jgi:hypothetical protein